MHVSRAVAMCATVIALFTLVAVGGIAQALTPAGSTYAQLKSAGASYELTEENGCVGLDRNSVLVFGNMKRNDQEYDAVILRGTVSKDPAEGIIWTPVLKGERNHTIICVTFIDDRIGWALSLWTVEGAAEAFVYRTPDGGKTWARIGEIPIPTPLAYPNLFQFKDIRNGRMSFEVSDPTVSTDGTVVYTTTDGGKSWVKPSHTELSWPSQKGQPNAGASCWHVTTKDEDYIIEYGPKDGVAETVGRLPRTR